MSDTPRTDAMGWYTTERADGMYVKCVSMDDCRRLERDLSAAHDELRRLQGVVCAEDFDSIERVLQETRGATE